MARFVINPKSSGQKEVPLNSQAVSIGRDPTNDLVLSDSMVSRRHAMLELRNETYYVRDNNSSNGTFVNGDRLEEEVALKDGDLVSIGSSKLLFHAGSGAPRQAFTPEPGGVLPTTGLDRSVLPPTKPLDLESSACVSCGTPYTSGDRFCRSCGTPVVERVSEPAQQSRSTPAADSAPAKQNRSLDSNPTRIAPRPLARRSAEPAGFWIRFVAYLIDGIILFIPLLIVNVILWAMSARVDSGAAAVSPFIGIIAGALVSIGGVAYLALFWGLRGATPGKSLLSLEVRTEDGDSPIGVPRALLRVLGYAVSSGLFCLGFVWIAFSPEKRGLHDLIAKTAVVRNS